MKRILMLVANGVEPLEMAAFTDVMGWATLLGKEDIELIDVGLKPTIKTKQSDCQRMCLINMSWKSWCTKG
jgi:hypothetical protein